MRVRDATVTQPGRLGSPLVPSYDRDTVGRSSERVARFMGTGRYLAIQTVVVAVWITINVVALSYPAWASKVFAPPSMLDVRQGTP